MLHDVCRLESERAADRAHLQALQASQQQQLASLQAQQQQQISALHQQHAAAVASLQQQAAVAAAAGVAESAAVRSGAAGLAGELGNRQANLLKDMAALAVEIEGYRCGEAARLCGGMHVRSVFCVWWLR
jgi:hypothetical protein